MTSCSMCPWRWDPSRPGGGPIRALAAHNDLDHGRGPWIEVRPLDADGAVVALKARSAELFALLAREPGHVVRFDEIAEAMYGGPQNTKNVPGMVRYLRGQLGADAIETVYGFGYRLRRWHERVALREMAA